jgi:hypothetical protein
MHNMFWLKVLQLTVLCFYGCSLRNLLYLLSFTIQGLFMLWII